MNQVTQAEQRDESLAIPAPFFVRGRLVEAQEVVHRSRDLGASFVTPLLDMDALITPRTEPGPLFDTPLAEIIDFLAEAGERLVLDKNEHLQAVVDRVIATNVVTLPILRDQLTFMSAYLNKTRLYEVVEQSFGNPKVLDDWIPRVDSQGRKSWTRAFPPRLLHVLPGNSPSNSAKSVATGAMCKAINVFKMGSSDPFMAVAVLRTMAEIDPNHPLPRSMSAVYWRGGDEQVERTLFRPQYFDRIVAWGGGEAINNVIKYLMPGLQLVSFDPKTSISMIGREVFESDQVLEEAAQKAARDVSVLNQEACVSSRIIFIEGEQDQVDQFCRTLQQKLVDFNAVFGKPPPPPREIAEEVAAMRMMDDEYGVWGKADGAGLVVRTTEPVGFHPSNKTANVVMVPSLEDALKYVNVATQTVGIFPPARQAELRNGLASGGAQMIVRLGDAGGHSIGAPHDAMYPLQRFVHWIVHEDGFVPA